MSKTIRSRIALSLAIRIALIALVTGVAVYGLCGLARDVENASQMVKESELFSDLQLAIAQSIMPVNDYLMTGRQDEITDFDRQSRRLEALLAVADRLPLLDENERALLNQTEERYDRLKSLVGEIFALRDPVGSAEGVSLMKEFEAVGEKMVLGLDQYRPQHQRELTGMWKSVAESRRQGLFFLIGSGAGVALLSLVLGIRLARSVIRPIRLLESGTERIAAGDWFHRVDVRSGDELEVLANRFNRMAEKLGEFYRSTEEQLAGGAREIVDQLEDLNALLQISAEFSATLESMPLLTLIAERMAHIVKATYCRIALINEDRPELITRAAYPIRTLDWEPGVGRVFGLGDLPSIRCVFETGRYVLLSSEEINRPDRALERERLFTPNTRSALIYPLILANQLKGVIILGEARSWTREPFTEKKIALCQTLVNQAVVAIANAQNYADLHETFLGIVKAMASAIDAKSPWTQGHSERVTLYAVAIGKEMKLEAPAMNHLRLGCLLHDIGKIGTCEAILDKPDRLTDDEQIIMKKHPLRGEEILKTIRLFRPILPIIRNHHERYDGTGYPDGLKGEEIPLLARVAALADTYDSMTADRPYRKAPGREKAIAEIQKYAGVQFDPAIAAVFLALLNGGLQ